jgi:hypothetical protein
MERKTLFIDIRLRCTSRLSVIFKVYTVVRMFSFIVSNFDFVVSVIKSITEHWKRSLGENTETSHIVVYFFSVSFSTYIFH